MKNLLPVALILALSSSACAQKLNETDVPQPVKTSFAKQFPKAESAKWELEDKTDYEVNFKHAGQKMSAKYSAAGKWMETEQDITEAELPEPVRKAIAANYADHKMEGAEKAETPEGTVYEVDLEKGEHEMEVVFNADGKVLKTKVENENKSEKGKGDDEED
jgi:hypothetical protein